MAAAELDLLLDIWKVDDYENLSPVVTLNKYVFISFYFSTLIVTNLTQSFYVTQPLCLHKPGLCHLINIFYWSFNSIFVIFII